MSTVTVNTKKMLLSGSLRVYKTESFIMQTRKVVAIDVFLSRAAENVFANANLGLGHFCLETDDKQFTLFFCNVAPGLTGDVVFYDVIVANPYEGGVDRRLSELLFNETFNLTIREVNPPEQQDFSRIYLVSTGDNSVNFPLLNPVQRKIVQTENANMLVQGVAGSGKTNVCVEKIVYCACRNYRGRVLYTTFSRGLLHETQGRVNLFLKNILDFVSYYESGNVVFLDANHKKAVENKLGILFDTDDDVRILQNLKRIAAFLQQNVDYFLLEDLHKQYFGEKPVADENTFLADYLGGKNCRLTGALEKIKNVAPELIYKEIYGMIFGKYEIDSPSEMMSREAYAQARKDSFSRAECDVIYSVAVDYKSFLDKNGYVDNNIISRNLLAKVTSPLYSVSVVDEAQDFTQVNLCLIKRISRKLFCVGDALQMINPSYFNFGYVKRLMYGDVTGVAELKHNYRSTETIEKISQKLGELNMMRFGTHSFVLRGESVRSELPSTAVFVKGNFAPNLADKRLENVTVVVSSRRKKEELRKFLGKTEILTVAEAKGLERGTIVLVDVLADNIDKWNYLQTMSLNRKTADENSVFRYYFNLFYVGVSRAKQHLFVAEREYPQMFDALFDECFVKKSKDDALATLLDVAGKIELDDDELIDRIQNFCRLEQYENACFAADRLTDANRETQLAHIYVHEHYLRYGKWRDAGVEYWRRGMDAEAREAFTRSGDEKLFPLMDACKSGGGALDVEIIKFLPIVADNDVAVKLILETVANDCKQVTEKQKAINEIFRRRRKQ